MAIAVDFDQGGNIGLRHRTRLCLVVEDDLQITAKGAQGLHPLQLLRSDAHGIKNIRKPCPKSRIWVPITGEKIPA